MTRHFMRDTPLYQMEQMMMTPPYFKPRGHSLRRSGFRYKALGNSVAIPCVDYVLHGISLVLLAS